MSNVMKMKSAGVVWCFIAGLISVACQQQRPFTADMAKMVIADFENSNPNKGLTELFYPIYDSASLRMMEKEGHHHLELTIQTHHPDYFIAKVTPGSVYYSGKERVPYDIVRTNAFTYYIVDYVSKPLPGVLDTLKSQKLLVEFDATKPMLVNCHVMIYYYFICRDNVNTFQKVASLDIIPEEKMPEDFCSI